MADKEYQRLAGRIDRLDKDIDQASHHQKELIPGLPGPQNSYSTVRGRLKPGKAP